MLIVLVCSVLIVGNDLVWHWLCLLVDLYLVTLPCGVLLGWWIGGLVFGLLCWLVVWR